ncbi:MAG TPA: primosomal protein N' [Thermoanaerobaculia bacterium]|nr:primosomal protein N' [Thermoanaerobaculia bacterium]
MPVIAPHLSLPYAEVALPLPLPEPLVYEVPPGLRPQALPGVRVRVRVGKRRLSGVIVGLRETPPAAVSVRPIEGVLDRSPVLSADLLELARFIAGYYMAALGEVLRTMLPAQLAPWGDRRIWLTDRGALATRCGPGQQAVLDALHELGRVAMSDLQARLGLADLDAVVAGLAQRGLIAMEEGRAGLPGALSGRARTARYVSGVELAPGEPAALLAACGRTAAGRAVVEYLAAVGRPATTAEVAAAAACSAAVVKRLVARGVLRQFTQVERLSLDRHRLAPADASSSSRPPRELRADQASAVSRLVEVIERREFAPLLLSGVTGSGKTEVYLRAAETALAHGRSAILLVPEIALVPALARAVLERFGEQLAILHSGLGSGERNQEWERVRRGEARVVLGPRSALFAPVADLGLLVVDEEQDPAYKQEITPRYHARDLALVRGRSARAATLLVSATPSLESRYNVQRGKLEPLRLTARFGQGALPEGILVDLRQEEGVRQRPGEVTFSARLRQEIASALAADEQVILLRNRRGYAPMLLCRACGEAMRCDDCGLPRTYHRRARRLQCHYCGSGISAPGKCPVCSEAALEPIGAGTERVEEDFRALFPAVNVDVLDRDTARRTGGLAAVLERFERGELRVLIGTQMVSKGHHFPGVSLTAVLAADAYLSFPDFRAVERTYNLLTQLAGRGGRGERPGRVVIQTYHPDHYAIRAALTGDDAAFLAEELRFRRVFHYPPYTRMVQLLVRDRNRERAQSAIRELAQALAAHPLSRAVRITGPAPAPLERLRGEWRFQLLARSAAGRDLHRLLEAVVPRSPAYDLTIDVDPQQLL